MEDLERIARIEKAISEKYGEVASRDVRHFWDDEKEREYARQSEEENKKRFGKEVEKKEVEKNGFLLITKNKGVVISAI